MLFIFGRGDVNNMEKVANARVVIVENICDKCGNGKMKPHGNSVLATYPPQYPHVCENCGHMENYPFTYPYHRIVPTEALREPVGKEIVND